MAPRVVELAMPEAQEGSKRQRPDAGSFREEATLPGKTVGNRLELKTGIEKSVLLNSSEQHVVERIDGSHAIAIDHGFPGSLTDRLEVRTIYSRWWIDRSEEFDLQVDCRSVSLGKRVVAGGQTCRAEHERRDFAVRSTQLVNPGLRQHEFEP